MTADIIQTLARSVRIRRRSVKKRARANCVGVITAMNLLVKLLLTSLCLSLVPIETNCGNAERRQEHCEGEHAIDELARGTAEWPCLR